MRSSTVSESPLRKPLLAAWQRTWLPILSGPLRGRKWLPASGGKILRVLAGSYEPEQTRLFCESIQSGDTVLDVGAAAGYYTLLTSGLVGKPGRVVAFEPDNRNAKYLRNHVAANHIENVTVHQSAVGARDETARFAFGTGSGTGRLSEDGSVSVQVCSLDSVVASERCQPSHIKIDVEGAEIAVIDGAQSTLQEFRPVIFLSTHGKEIHRACCSRLQACGYDLTPVDSDDLRTATEVLCRAA